ncbi:hypothetical protein ACFQ0G_18980 [Streptomyces chiangmaiensis]
MRLSTRIGLAVGLTVPLLVLASGWLLLRLVAQDLHREQDRHLRERAVSVLPDARALLRATAAGRPQAADTRERRLYNAALDVGIRVVGPTATFSGGPQPGASVALPTQATAPVTVRQDGHSWRALSVPVEIARARGTLWVFQADTADRTQVRLVRRRVVLTALLAAPCPACSPGASPRAPPARCAAWAAVPRASTRAGAPPGCTTSTPA